jgi:hypothetical protein
MGAADNRTVIKPSSRSDHPEQPVPGKAPSSPDRYNGIALGVECAWPARAFSGLADLQSWTSSGDFG